ncbi:MAG: hypothetical protein WCG87_01155 [Bacteroidota bacterium]
MENLQGKAHFLRNEYIKKLAHLTADTPRLWGNMNAPQMIEHMSDYVRIGSGKTPHTLLSPEERLTKLQGFLMSEKPFPENTPNILMPDTPAPTKHISIAEAISELQAELDHFFSVFEKDPNKTITNPFFGDLNYDMSVQLLHKHALHHLRQFGVKE